MLSNSPLPPYGRAAVGILRARLLEPRHFIQVVSGPRQVGKTTLVRQAVTGLGPLHFISADDPGLRAATWLAAQWEVARRLPREEQPAILVVDEIQKIPGWSETVKRLWDEDSATDTGLRVVLLGSAPLPIQAGLSESLAGRFELIRVAQWSFAEMRAAFGWDLPTYLRYGGYPGAVPLVGDLERWRAYVLDSLIETTLSRDLLLLTRIDKPALLRQLFRLGCDYSAQVLSYQKLSGQLQDAGNTVTLAHYLRLLGGIGLLAGLEKHAGSRVRQRGSSPKLLALDPGLVTAMAGYGIDPLANDDARGRAVETAVGAHLVNTAHAGIAVGWWRERNQEVDFVLSDGRQVLAIEVASGRRKPALPGLAAFVREFPGARPLLVGGQGLGLEDALSMPAADWLSGAAPTG
jgi:predicted AAA+ superfamily ATPase